MATSTVKTKAVTARQRQSSPDADRDSSQCLVSPLRLGLWWAFWLVLVGVGLLLSQWQWQRAEQKREIEQFLLDAETLFNPLEEPSLFANVTLTGTFADQESLWLDNRIHEGQVGVALMTPFVDVNGRWWLVDRGFVETGGHRRALDDQLPNYVGGLVVINATWQPLDPHNLAFSLDSQPEGMRIPRIDPAYWMPRSQIDSAPAVQQSVEQRFRYSGVLHLQDTSQGMDGRLRWWQPTQMSPQRHMGYSLQWLLLAFIALLFAFAGQRFFRSR